MEDAIFPRMFWPLALAHGLALLSPGPDFVLIVSNGIRYAWRGAALLCVGIAAGNAVYIALAIACWLGWGGSPGLYRILQPAGALYLGWLGVRLLASSRSPLPDPDGGGTRLPPFRQLVVGFGSAVLNPKNMVFYLAIMTTIIEREAGLGQRFAAGAWMCLAVLSWDLFLAGVASHRKVRFFLRTHLPKIETACGLILFFFAISLLAPVWRWGA